MDYLYADVISKWVRIAITDYLIVLEFDTKISEM